MNAQSGTLPNQNRRACASPGNKNKYNMSEIPVFGDKLITKNNTSFRIYFENSDGLPSSEMSNCTWKYKTKINQIIRHFNIDVVGLAETQVNWDMVESKFNITQHIEQTIPTRFSKAHKSNEKLSGR